MNPPPTNTAIPHKNGVKNFSLTPMQGCVLLIVLVVGFGGIIYWISNMYPRSFTGTVKTSVGTLAPYGCHSEGSQLVIPLRPDPQPDGFNEENRALLFKHNITERSTNSAIPAKVATVSWRDQDKNVTQISCSKLEDVFTVFRKRRGGQRLTRQDYWSGTVQATCEVPGVGSVEVDLDVENCGR